MAPENGSNGWNIKTLYEHVVTLIEGIADRINGNDKRYTQEFDNQKQAVKDALAAQKEQTSAAFASSEKAITKAEGAQTTYNQGHNDLSRKMEDQYKLMVPLTEYKNGIKSIEEKIDAMKGNFDKRMDRTDDDIRGLRESRSGQEGRGTGDKERGANIYMIIILIFGAVGMIVGIIGAIMLVYNSVKH